MSLIPDFWVLRLCCPSFRLDPVSLYSESSSQGAPVLIHVARLKFPTDMSLRRLGDCGPM